MKRYLALTLALTAACAHQTRPKTQADGDLVRDLVTATAQAPYVVAPLWLKQWVDQPDLGNRELNRVVRDHFGGEQNTDAAIVLSIVRSMELDKDRARGRCDVACLDLLRKAYTLLPYMAGDSAQLEALNFGRDEIERNEVGGFFERITGDGETLLRSVVADMVTSAPKDARTAEAIATVAAIEAGHRDYPSALRFQREVCTRTTCGSEHTKRAALLAYHSLAIAEGDALAAQVSPADRADQEPLYGTSLDVIATLAKQRASLERAADYEERLRAAELDHALCRDPEKDELYNALKKEAPDDARPSILLAKHAGERHDWAAAFTALERAGKEHREPIYYELVATSTLVPLPNASPESAGPALRQLAKARAIVANHPNPKRGEWLVIALDVATMLLSAKEPTTGALQAMRGSDRKKATAAIEAIDDQQGEWSATASLRSAFYGYRAWRWNEMQAPAASAPKLRQHELAVITPAMCELSRTPPSWTFDNAYAPTGKATGTLIQSTTATFPNFTTRIDIDLRKP